MAPGRASSRPAGRSALRPPRARAPARRRASRPRTRRLPRSSRPPSRHGSASRSAPANDAPAAPRLRIQATPLDRAADDLVLVLVRKDDVGCQLLDAGRKPLGPEVADHAPRREVDAHPRPHGARLRDGGCGSESDRLAQEGIARDVEVVAALQPRRVDLVRPQLGRDAAVGAHRPLSGRVHERDDDAVPVRLDRADELDARVAAAARPRGARRVGSTFADEPRRPPSAATQAATFAAWPPGRSTICEVASASGASGCSSRTITSSTRSPRQQIVIAYDPRMDAQARAGGSGREGRGSGAAGLRSLVIGGCSVPRRRPPRAAFGPATRRRETQAGLGAFESAPATARSSERRRSDGP